MADIANTEVQAKGVSGFKLVRQEDGIVSICKAGKKIVFLNHGTKDVDFPSKGNTVKPATQELMKAIYDTDPSYVSLVEAPQGYKAPWA
jgi:hypothetical protein